jgi:hypothetical protein
MMKSRRKLTGYMIEIPIIVVVIGVLLSVILPKLPPLGQKITVVLGALVFIAGAYYMIVIPGWQPEAKRLRPPWSLLVFALVALLIAFVAGAFVFAH